MTSNDTSPSATGRAREEATPHLINIEEPGHKAAVLTLIKLDPLEREDARYRWARFDGLPKKVKVWLDEGFAVPLIEGETREATIEVEHTERFGQLMILRGWGGPPNDRPNRGPKRQGAPSRQTPESLHARPIATIIAAAIGSCENSEQFNHFTTLGINRYWEEMTKVGGRK